MDKVLDGDRFKDAGSEVANHSFLLSIMNGEITYEQWRDYVMLRLSAGDDFVQFLTQVEQTRRNAGYNDLANAVASNISEELGIYNGEEDLSRRHDEWRKWCREGVMKILAGKEVSFVAPAEDARAKYQDALNELLETNDPIIQSGALVALEEIIACEYERVLEVVAIQFPELEQDARAMTYWRSHAFHDHRHFDELFEPLKALCDTPDKLQRALKGLAKIQKTKMEFLDNLI